MDAGENDEGIQDYCGCMTGDGIAPGGTNASGSIVADNAFARVLDVGAQAMSL